jgi:hypothetical protein
MIAPSGVLAAPLAFPEAEGFGAMATGGRGGQAVHVTTLADSGTGSLRDAVSGSNRIVVFDVSGVINIASALVVAGDNITLAGQSAPGAGVTIYGRETSFSSRSNIIVRYLRFRQGMGDSDSSAKCVNVTDGQNMIFDHVSIQWGRWDNFGVTGTSTTVTLQNSIIGEGMPPQRFGSIMDSVQDITVARNLWIDNESRNPKFKANGQDINNVVYDWGNGGGIIGGHSSADWYEDLINNYLIAGPTTVDGFLTFYANTDLVYQSGNMVDVNQDGQLNGRAVVEADFAYDATPPTFETSAHNTPSVPVTVVSAEDAYAQVVAQAGTCQLRDAVETRLVAQLQSLGKTGAIISTTGSEADVGGQPAMTEVSRPAGYDTDGDGMPDAWETAHGLDPNDPSDGTGDYNGDGYTNVEKYLNEAADLLCPGGSSTSSDAGSTAGDSGVLPGADAGSQMIPDASSPGTDASAARPDATIAGGDASTMRPDASMSGADTSAPVADAANPGVDADVGRADAATPTFDAAGFQADATASTVADAGSNAIPGSGDASSGAGTAPDDAGSASGSTAAPATAASGCNCSIGPGLSTADLRFALWAMGLLVIARSRSAGRHRRWSSVARPTVCCPRARGDKD